jgi:DegV family protein with EDD domain
VSGTAIVTDSTCYLPPELVTKAGITPVSLYVTFADGSVRRELELDLAEFYGRLVSDSQLPTTAPPTVEDFLAVYEPLVAEGKTVVSIHISSGLSETCNVARQAATRLMAGGGGRVEVADGATTAGPLGLLALAAAAGAVAGEDADTVIQRVRDARQTMKNWFVLDTLEFLRRGGRVGGATAWLGSRLQVKPILTIETEARAVERVRTMDRAFERLVEFAHRLHSAGAHAWFVQHVHSPEAADRLVDRCQKIFRCPPALVSEIGPVVGTHLGPGGLFVGGMDPEYLEAAPRSLRSSARRQTA